MAHGDLAYAYEIEKHPAHPEHLIVRVLEPEHNDTYDIMGWSVIQTAYLPSVGELGAKALEAKRKKHDAELARNSRRSPVKV